MAIEKIELPTSRKNLLQKLGYGFGDGRIKQLVEKTADLVLPRIAAKKIVKTFNIRLADNSTVILENGFEIRSKSIASLLKGCNKATIFLVTIGDIFSGSGGTIAEQSIADKLGSVAVEELAEHVNNELEAEANAKGFSLTKRFSCGYGDWQLKDQARLIDLLDASRAGVTINQKSLLMSPVKTISAIIGWHEQSILENLSGKLVILDGGMGTLLQAEGFKGKFCPEELNLTHPDTIRKIHMQYVDDGAQIIETNTFGANRIKLSNFKLEGKVTEINSAGVKIAKEAAKGKALVAASIGPLGEFLEPLGNISFDAAYEAFSEQVRACKDADIILIETISDIRVAKAAVLAAKDNCGKPIFVSLTFEDGRMTTGTDAKTAASILEALGVDAIGLNCSAGPKELRNTVKQICESTNLPVIVYPNAGIPKIVDGKTEFTLSPEDFAEYSSDFVKFGANIIGGCCGTTPKHIKKLAEKLQNLKPTKRDNPQYTRVCSRTQTLEIKKAAIIGESINPTNQKKLSTEIANKRFSLIKQIAINETNAGAAMLDLNISIAGGNDKEFLPKAVAAVEGVSVLPICIDNTNPEALEAALKTVSGKALINSVNGKESSLKALLPIAKRYGCAIIGLTLDEHGIPKTAEERVQIAKKIISRAIEAGIPCKDIIIDCLVSTVAAEPQNASVCIEALKEVKKLGVKTVLGISNVSQGLPNRREINFKFLCEALNAGLDVAIINPFDELLVQAVRNSERFTSESSFDRFVKSILSKKPKKLQAELPIEEKLKQAVINGIEDAVVPIVKEALRKMPALKVNDRLLEGLNEVGVLFREKNVFLPTVLLSASTMKCAFGELKHHLESGSAKIDYTILFATVENDIHDIGKNIVVALLQSHGFKVIDLGKDVNTDKIVKCALEEKPDIICLSALMTTTAAEMPKTINALRAANMQTQVMVGGAVVTSEFASKISALYGKDAIDAVNKIKSLAKASQQEFFLDAEDASSKFQRKLESKKTVYSAELSIPKGTDLTGVYRRAELLADVVDAMNIPDNPCSVMKIGGLAVAHLLQERGYETILHVTARDKNKIAIQSDLLAADSLGIKNILALRGDPQEIGDHPDAKPVFELSSVKILETIQLLNSGKDLAAKKLKGKTNLFAGAAFCFGKDHQKDVENVKNKIYAGAKFFQSQLVYDVDLFLDSIEDSSLYQPKILAGIMPIQSYKMAVYICKNIPGVSVPTPIIKRIKYSRNQLKCGLEIARETIEQIKDECNGIHLMPMNHEERVLSIIV